MLTTVPGLMEAVRNRFAHVDACPFEGPRVFFENAGGALTLKSVAETSGRYAAYPDNQGRDNAASRALMAAIDKGKADMRLFFNAPDGQVFVGESGTEVLFRLIRTAALGAGPGGTMLSTTPFGVSTGCQRPRAASCGCSTNSVTSSRSPTLARTSGPGIAVP